VNPSGGELRSVLDRCRAGNELAWEQWLAWVRTRAPAFLSEFRTLSAADKEDVAAAAIGRLVGTIRRDEIRGVINLEIETYVRRTIKNLALNLIRGRRARPDQGHHLDEKLPDPTQRPSEEAVVSNLRARADEAVMRWPPKDRYLFFAKLEGVESAKIKVTLERPPYAEFISVKTVDTRYHKLKKTLREEIDR
jgi:DNA-directed RNA polymerase specialized sigma24 family protein